MSQQITKANLACLRCGTEMELLGTKKFPEGIDWGDWLGDWGNLLNRKEKFDVIGCLKCGKIEFFFDKTIKQYQNLDTDE